MTEFPVSVWGTPDCYYAAEPLRALDRAGEYAGSRWAKALDQVSPGIRETVERTYKQRNTILRDYRLGVRGRKQEVTSG